MKIQSLVPTVLLAVTASVSPKSLRLNNEADLKFTGYLRLKMVEYPMWIQDNHLDPSPPIPDTIVLPLEQGFYANLACNLSEQVIQGHSKTTDDSYQVESVFQAHHVSALRDVYTRYEFLGEYRCTGLIHAVAFDELKTDLPFFGYGQFAARVLESLEAVAITNIGITEDYKFDMSHSQTDYAFEVGFNSIRLNGQWNNTQVVNYIDKIEDSFSNLYRRFFRSTNIDDQRKNPSRQQFVRYMEELLKNVTLTTIIGEEDLPPPYSPSPIATTPRSTK